ncbi:MAG TPA: methylmalonyl Co-A mutase-associated GTPase MeaB [Anaerolineales bacterium]
MTGTPSSAKGSISLAAAVLTGERLALARLLSQIENQTPEGREMLSELFPHTGNAHLVGITGAPGTGKSTLVNQLARYYRNPPDGEVQRSVAIVAVDPSSPFTGGAILGDRVRMRDLSGDPGVFIRSMAARGSLGGLAHATASVVQAFDAAGFEVVLIETVGAGQAEVDVARLAHTTVVVEAPGLGDDIQAIKAGILEIADVLVVNKADRPGVENTERALRNMLQLAHPVPRVFRAQGYFQEQEEVETASNELPLWTPPVLRSVATEGHGVAELAKAIQKHRDYLDESGDWGRRERARFKTELDALLQDKLVARWRNKVPASKYKSVLEQVVERQISPYQAVEALLDGDRYVW